MTAFEFDAPKTSRTNQAAPADDSCVCGGDRFIQVADHDHTGVETYMRCPQCNAAPSEAREPVAQDAWWKA